MFIFLSTLILTESVFIFYINKWYKVFYDSLQDKDLDTFISSFYVIGEFNILSMGSWGFLILTAGLVITGGYIDYFGNRFSFKIRENLTSFYLPEWKKKKKYLEGSSQRLQEDTRRYSKRSWQLWRGFLSAISLLFLFIPLLWGQSFGYEIDGLLVWAALGIGAVGVGVSWIIGRKLPKLEYNNQVVEAEFRRSLLQSQDDSSRHTLDELKDQFEKIKINYFRLFDKHKYYSFWEKSYYQAGIVLPYVVVAPQFFAGAMSLGVVVQISNAFLKIHESMSFFTKNWLIITQMKSVVIRLGEFHEVILKDMEEEELNKTDQK
jgi:peptide/bleomycin uptake transporter